jgi:SAM-dependent MidA family methyltransferase
LNQWHWKYTYKSLHEEQEGMWFTPVELFYPYYSNILANFITESISNNLQSKHEDVFDIVELGGGRGTNAKAVLNHLNDSHPEMYDRLQSYTIYDTSPTLHELQRKVLVNDSSHADKVKLVNIDMMDIAEGNTPFLEPSDTPTALIALELLDNLPHDKIARCIQTGNILQAEVIPLDSSESDVVSDQIDTSIPYKEIFSPLDDPLLQNILSLSSTYDPTISRWVPTVALGILLRLFECRPNSSLMFADFDWLPLPDADQSFTEKATGDPLVTDMNGNDHPSYLTSPPNALCDILFPTDFSRMQTFGKKVIEQSNNDFVVSSMKQRDFLMKYGADEVSKTKGWSGYSPLTDDFGNCSVLTIAPR